MVQRIRCFLGFPMVSQKFLDISVFPYLRDLDSKIYFCSRSFHDFSQFPSSTESIDFLQIFLPSTVFQQRTRYLGSSAVQVTLLACQRALVVYDLVWAFGAAWALMGIYRMQTVPDKVDGMCWGDQHMGGQRWVKNPWKSLKMTGICVIIWILFGSFMGDIYGCTCRMVHLMR